MAKPKMSDRMKARTLIAAASFHRKHGQVEIARIYEAQARELAPELIVGKDGAAYRELVEATATSPDDPA